MVTTLNLGCWGMCGRRKYIENACYCTIFYFIFFNFLAFDFCRSAWFFRFIHPRHIGQWPPTSKGFSIPDFIHYIYFPILILEKEPVFPFLMFSAKQGNYWYHYYNVFGMTQSLTGDWTRDLPHSKPALYHQAIEEAVLLHYWDDLIWKSIRY